MTGVSFVGSFPAADFRVEPALPEIAFVGRSNVGKSSLINALTGSRSLARVSKTPGKTRACNVYRVDAGWYLVDLPGYGFARVSQAERQAFQRLLGRYIEQRPNLAAVVWLLDIRRDPSPADLAMVERFAGRGVPLLAAITKSDKIPLGRRGARLAQIARDVGLPEDQCVLTSTRTGDGIRDLRESIQALATPR